MKKFSFISGIGLLCTFSAVFSQNAEDALRYSQSNAVGTTRFMSMGGAFGALGGDFSVISTNPAGLAVFRKSELMFTPSVYSQKSITDYNNNSREDYKLNFNLGNAGLVLADVMQPYGDASGWVSRSFSFGYNRINNFHNNIFIEGTNSSSSLLDVYLSDALNSGNAKNPEDLNPFGSMLAYNTYLIDDTSGNLNYFSQIPKGSDLLQRKTISNTGSMGETYFAFAGNYSNKLYLGASVGFSSINFSQTANYEELTDLEDSTIILDYYTLTEDLTSKGKGVNLKAGLIYRVNDWVRLGAAFHTPTMYSMTDNWNSTIKAHYRAGSVIENNSPSGKFNYNINTPAKVIGSLAFIINKSGILSADYELVDYSSARLRSSSESYFTQNEIIQNNLKPAGNIKIGTEWKFDPFSLRAGYNHQGNPYKNNSLDGSRTSYSLGFGLREEGYFLDFGYALTQSKSQHYLYDPQLVNPANSDLVSHNFMMTVGFKF